MKILNIHKLDCNDEPPVSTLHSGEHIFGRGDLLKCNDQRVSRNHGIIKITDDAATITSTHQNPCFYQSVNSSNITILPKDVPVTINNGDKFALLPDQYWFKIDIKTSVSLDTFVDNEPINEDNLPLKQNDVDEANTTLKTIKVDNKRKSVSCTSQTNSNLAIEMLFSSDEEENNLPLKQNHVDKTNTPKKIKIDKKKSVACTSQTDSKLPMEMLFSSDEEDIPDNGEVTEVVNSKEDPSTSGTKAKRQWRDRCWYGSSCYRKSSSHLKKYSHPNDSDYGTDPEDNRPICAFGGSCYRRNKDHRQTYKHPSNNKKVPPKDGFNKVLNKKRVTRPNYKESSEEDDDMKDPFRTDGNSSSEYEANEDAADSTDSNWTSAEDEN